MKVEVVTHRSKTTFEGENVGWTNISGYLKVFVDQSLRAEFQPSAWDVVLVVNESE